MSGISGVEPCFVHEVVTMTTMPDLTGANVLQRKTGGLHEVTCRDCKAGLQGIKASGPGDWWGI